MVDKVVKCPELQMQSKSEGVLYGAIARLELAHDFVHRATPVSNGTQGATGAAAEEMTPRRESSEIIALLTVENKELHDEHDVRMLDSTTLHLLDCFGRGALSREPPRSINCSLARTCIQIRLETCFAYRYWWRSMRG